MGNGGEKTNGPAEVSPAFLDSNDENEALSIPSMIGSLMAVNTIVLGHDDLLVCRVAPEILDENRFVARPSRIALILVDAVH
jgi:hypothetical protein